MTAEELEILVFDGAESSLRLRAGAADDAERARLADDYHRTLDALLARQATAPGFRVRGWSVELVISMFVELLNDAVNGPRPEQRKEVRDLGLERVQAGTDRAIALADAGSFVEAAETMDAQCRFLASMIEWRLFGDDEPEPPQMLASLEAMRDRMRNSARRVAN